MPGPRNRCETLNVCPLGDLAERVGCRRPHCPSKTMADVASPLIALAEAARAGRLR